jgi:hypothetical protein
MSVKNDILDNLATLLKTVQRGATYNTDINNVFRYVPTRENATATPSICLLQERDDIVARDSKSGYNLHDMKLSLAFYIVYDAARVDEILNDAIADVYKVLHATTSHSGSAIHAQCVRLRISDEDKYFNSPETNEAAVRMSINIIYYQART